MSTVRIPLHLAAILLLAIVALAACAPATTALPTQSAQPTQPATAPVATSVPPAQAPTNPPAAAPTNAPAATAPSASAAMAEIKVADSKLGKILTDGKGMTLYIFTKDTPNTSTCYDACAKNWPPLLSDAKPTLGDGVDGALIGTTQRKEGTSQVTYNGMPLYYWANDKAAGDTTGQGVGGVWWVIAPDGKAITTGAAPAAAPTTAPAANTPASSASANVVEIKAVDSTFGKILADGKGMTLYIFTKDTANTSNCYDACATNWPPLLSNGKPDLGDGVDSSLIGSTQRKDGTTQVTYKGMPLYYWAKDKQAGDTTGQGVGGVWWVITPAGEAITAAPAPAAAPTATKSAAPGSGY